MQVFHAPLPGSYIQTSSKVTKTVQNQNNPALIFIDPSVDQASAVSYAAGAKAELIFLSGAQDGLAQILRQLGRRGKLPSIHIMAEMSQGQLTLCGRTLGLRELRERAPELARIGGSMKAAGEILIGLGRDRDGHGEQFLRALGEFAGVPVRFWRCDEGVNP